MKPPSPPPLRMPRSFGHPAQARNPKPPPGHPAVAGFRAKIYQGILALMNLADKLSLDLFRQQDCFGLDWRGLAGQAAGQYKADAVQFVQELQGLIMSKEGAQYLPKGLYRDLLVFLEAGDEFQKWARGGGFEEAVAALAPAAAGAEPAGNPLLQAAARLQKACQDIQQRICIFENERAAGEESFFS